MGWGGEGEGEGEYKGLMMKQVYGDS